jgi:exonuclease VII large subunit
MVLSTEKILDSNNPERQLRLGYSIAKLQGKVVRSISQVQAGQNVEVRLQDGSFKSDIVQISKI